MRTKKPKKELNEAFSEKYPKYAKILGMFEAANHCPATWENVTKANLAAFVEHMRGRLANTSVKTYCAMVKSVLNLYSDVVELPKGYEAILSPKSDVSQQTWLADKEITKLMEYASKNGLERLVKNQFLLGALTGARHNDYVNFSEKNIIGGSLVYVSQKTHIKSEIPLAPAVRRILEENERNGLSGKTVSDPTFNAALRGICRAAGINEEMKLYQAGEMCEGQKWQFISSHTARRSFATNLYLRGADMCSITMLMGHANTNMTEKYIVCGLRRLPENVLGYFRQFK